MEKEKKIYRKMIFPFLIIVSSLLTFATSLYSYLLFHALVEIFTVVISFGIFVIAWSSRRYINNAFLFIIGVGYLFVGGLDTFHTLSYEGMNITSGYGANIASQLWISARYLEAATFLVALLFMAGNNKKIVSFGVKDAYRVLFVYAGIFLAIFLSIFYFKIFPQAYIEGQGMTNFKIYSEYIIIVLLFISVVLLFKKGNKFDKEMVNLLSLSLMLKIVSEIFFTQYIGVYDFSNLMGHLFRFISFLLLYKAVFEVGLDKPYKFMFHDLKKSEERYKSLVEFSPDPIVVHRKGKVLYANELAKRFFGIKEDKNVVGARVIDFFHPKYRERIEYRMKKIFSGEWKEAPRSEMEAINYEGKSIPVEVKGMKIIYEGKEAVESIIRDISERREAEKRIRSLAQFPEESPNPIIRSSGEGEIEYINKPAKAMLYCFDWTEEMPLPEPIIAAVKKVLEKNERPEFELACKNNHIYYINLAPSLTDNHVNIYGRDITERKKAEKKLAETQAELQRKIEEQLTESYKHMGLVNRKISLLLEVENSIGNKKNKQEVADYIVNSAKGLSGAAVAMLYASSGKNYFSMISGTGVDENKKGRISIVSGSSLNFIKKMFEEKRRINSSIEMEKSGTFNGNIDIDYFVVLPIIRAESCGGFLFLGFKDRKSMDPQELEFLDVFSRHISSTLVDSGIISKG